MTIYHYTKADTLLLILANRTIRFTRADLVDDASEVPFRTEYLDDRKFFISSWSLRTYGEAGMWARYGDADKGVRISLPSLRFPWSPLRIDVSREIGKLKEGGSPRKIGIRVKDLVTPYDQETFFGNGYIAVPMGTDLTTSFGSPVIYTDNPSAEVRRKVTLTEEGFGFRGDATYVARVKGKGWADQAEYRYVLSAFKGPQLDYRADPSGYENALLNQIEEGISNKFSDFFPTVRYIDLPLASNAFEGLIVTFGSSMPKEKRDVLKQRVKDLAPAAVFEECTLNVRMRS